MDVVSEPVDGDEDDDGSSSRKRESKSDSNGSAPPGTAGGDSDESDEGAVSLAVMEATLMPQVLKALEKIASTYTKLKKAQDTRLTNMQKGEEIEKSVERRFQKQKHELIELMEGVHLNNARIESLVEHLNNLNRKLVGLEGTDPAVRTQGQGQARGNSSSNTTATSWIPIG